MENHYDIIIIGGGLVGASFALALANSGMKIAVINDSINKITGAQDRSIVLAHTSKKIFQALNVWNFLESQTCPIKQIHVSERNGFGFTRMDATTENLSALGYVTSAGNINNALDEQLAKINHIKLIAAKFIALKNCKDYSEVIYESPTGTSSIRGRLIIAADGQNSSVRLNQNIGAKTFDYKHMALICRLTLNRSHQHIAYERFTNLGSIALLPINEKECSLIWSVPQNEVEKFLSLSDEDFLRKIQEKFGYRLGKFLAASTRKAIPLQLITSTEQVQPRLVLIGNAAHSLHPIAGQGLNLGLRDMAILAELLTSAFHRSEDIGSLQLLQKYVELRTKDQFFITNFTHQLIAIFSKAYFPVAVMRDMGLILIELISPLKHYLVDKALGKSGRLPRLACGLTLG